MKLNVDGIPVLWGNGSITVVDAEEHCGISLSILAPGLYVGRLQRHTFERRVALGPNETADYFVEVVPAAPKPRAKKKGGKR